MVDLSKSKDEQLNNVAACISKVYESVTMRKYFSHAKPPKKALLCLFISMSMWDNASTFWKRQYLAMAGYMGTMLRTYTTHKEMETPVLSSVEPAGHNRKEFGLFATHDIPAGQHLLMFFKRSSIHKFVKGDDPSSKFW